MLGDLAGLRYELTEDQSRMLNSVKPLNLVVGRSGTGKTTIALLRMVSLELLNVALLKQSEVENLLFVSEAAKEVNEAQFPRALIQRAEIQPEDIKGKPSSPNTINPSKKSS